MTNFLLFDQSRIYSRWQVFDYPLKPFNGIIGLGPLKLLYWAELTQRSAFPTSR